MGTCTVCGSETKHLYNWYSADLASTSTSTYEGFLVTDKTTTREYINVVGYSDYVCSKCGTKDATTGGLVLLSIGTVVLLALGVFAWIGAAHSGRWILAIIFSLVLLVGILFLFYNFGLPYIRRFTDRRVDEFDAVSQVWKKRYGDTCLVGKKLPHGWSVDDKVLFDADEYKALTPSM